MCGNFNTKTLFPNGSIMFFLEIFRFFYRHLEMDWLLSAKIAAIRRIVVWETGVSRHHGKARSSAPLKALNTTVLWCFERFQGEVWALMTPKDASLSDSCTSNRCSFSSLESCLTWKHCYATSFFMCTKKLMAICKFTYKTLHNLRISEKKNWTQFANLRKKTEQNLRICKKKNLTQLANFR